MRFLYSCLAYIMAPFITLYLYKRSRKNPDYKLHWNERFGFNLDYNVTKPIIWLHAVSVGETRAIAKIVELLNKNFPHYQILITQMTPTGRATAKKLYPQAILCYIPYDLPHAVINFYNTFKPQIGIIMETEIWPNLIHYAKQYSIPLFLVNARLSSKSFRNYNKVKFFIQPILNQFTAILCQDNITQKNFNSLGVTSNLQVVGSTKFDIGETHNQFGLAKHLKQIVQDKKTVIFASTRDGEEQQIIDNLNINYLTIIVPRHPERFKQVEAMLINKNISYLKRSQNTRIAKDTQVFLGDSMGEMNIYYSMSDLAVIGGSMNNLGGQNLIEPIFLNKPVIFGKSMFNFATIAKNALQDGCAIQVTDIRECFLQIDYLFTNEDKYLELKNNCNLFISHYRGASQKIFDIIRPYLSLTN